MIEFNEELLQKYDKLIWRKAYDFKKQSQDLFKHIELEDLHSEGVVCLGKCAQKFNPDNENKTKFITYFYIALQNDFADYFRNHSRAFRISANYNRDIVTATKLFNAGKSITEIGKEMKLTEFDVINLLNTNLCSHSFDYTSASEDDNNWLNYLPVENNQKDVYYEAMEYLIASYEASDVIKDKFRSARCFTDNPKVDETRKRTRQEVENSKHYYVGPDELIDNILRDMYCERNGILGRNKATVKAIAKTYNIDIYYLAPLLRMLTEDIEAHILNNRATVKELFNI